MRFNPMSEEDANAVNLMPKGEYDAVVRTAAEKTSQAGNQMFELQLAVYGPSGEQKLVFDWLVFTDGGHAKIQRFCKSADIWNLYQAGELVADGLAELNVRVKVAIEDGKDGFAAKNKVADYLPRKLPVNPQADRELRGVDPAKRTAALAASGPPSADADCPF